MPNVDKNQAIIDYFLTCEPIMNSTLYFNFANIKDATKQFITQSNDININRSFVDGTIQKRYSITIISFMSISNNPIIKVSGYSNENISDMVEVQTLIDWIATQNDEKHFPDFGENIVVEEIRTTTSNPRLDSIDASSVPAIARYSFTVQVDYIDYSHKIWNN